MEMHNLVWQSAAPLWKGYAGSKEHLERPAILRFDTDDFMDELFALLEREPQKLTGKVASTPPKRALKLYQPVHGHFHLVVASLVCDMLGLPDHAANPRHIGFVMRCLCADGKTELAWVAVEGEDGPRAWRPIDEARKEQLADGEEILAAFPVAYTEAKGQPRRVWAALIPVSTPEARLKAMVEGGAFEARNRYHLRAVYTRPACPPSRRHLVSSPSIPFRIASYADLEAPAREVTIPLLDLLQVAKVLPPPKPPKKKTPAFAIPAETRTQLDRAIGVRPAVENGLVSLKDPGAVPKAGLLCGFSIPIVTLAAYILLIIFVTLVEYILRLGWLPFLQQCIPLPPRLAPEPEE